jgi:flavin-dependent dehydrogenase
LASDIVVLEKARHPRPKVCAGGLIPNALTSLEELGVELTVPQVRVQRTQVRTPRRTVAHEDRDLCIVIRRNEFDAALAAACRARGITLRENEPVVELERTSAGVRVRTARATYDAQLVIGADGSGSVVRRRLIDVGRGHIARAVMCDVPVERTRWPGFDLQRYDFDFRAVADGLPGYRWMFPCWIDGVAHANVGIYALRASGAELNDSLRAYLGEITTETPRRHAFPIHWYGPAQRIAAPHVMLVGDAAGVDPLMGEGISLALEYGAFAAAAAQRALQTGDFSGREYERMVQQSWLGKKLRRLHLATRLFYGGTWRFWFALAERSARLRGLGIKWYNGVDGWDRRSGWEAVRALARTAG